MRAGRSPAGRMTRRMLMAGLASALAGCTLPRSGPTAGEILAAGDLPEYGLRIITVTPGVAEAVNRRETLSFGPDLVSAGVVAPDRSACLRAFASCASSTTAIFHFVASSAARRGPADPA